jgi:hypothetical protein
MAAHPDEPLFPDIDALNDAAYVDPAILAELTARVDPERADRVVKQALRDAGHPEHQDMRWGKRLLITWTFSSPLLAAAALAWVLWHLRHPVAYSADQIYAQAAWGITLLLCVPALAWSIVGVVDIERERLAEKRDRPERERLLDEAVAGLERLAAEARSRNSEQ